MKISAGLLRTYNRHFALFLAIFVLLSKQSIEESTSAPPPPPSTAVTSEATVDEGEFDCNVTDAKGNVLDLSM